MNYLYMIGAHTSSAVFLQAEQDLVRSRSATLPPLQSVVELTSAAAPPARNATEMTAVSTAGAACIAHASQQDGLCLANATDDWHTVQHALQAAGAFNKSVC
jgi:hypothetical protein